MPTVMPASIPLGLPTFSRLRALTSTLPPTPPSEPAGGDGLLPLALPEGDPREAAQHAAVRVHGEGEEEEAEGGSSRGDNVRGGGKNAWPGDQQVGCKTALISLPFPMQSCSLWTRALTEGGRGQGSGIILCILHPCFETFIIPRLYCCTAGVPRAVLHAHRLCRLPAIRPV